MKHTDFQNLLDRFGPDLTQWPAPSRREAEQAMARDAALADMLATERLLAECLADLPPVTASTDLRQRVMALPLAHPRAASRPGMLAGLWEGLWEGMAASWRQWSAGMATAGAAAVLGFVLGYGQMLPPVTGEEVATGDDLVAMLDLTADYDTAEVELLQ